MAARILELTGSGDYTAGSGTIDGKGAAVVIDAADQDEAYALAEAFFPVIIGTIPRGSIDIKDAGNGVFFVTVDYQSGIRGNTTDPAAGQTPTASRDKPEGGTHEKDEPLSRDVTFTMGGATRHITTSIETMYRIAKDGDDAPDFKGLIGVDKKTGEIHGCDVIAATSDFTISRKFGQITLGFFRNALDLVGTVNETPWLHGDAGEILFKGMDGNFRDGDAVPWSVTGRFSYARNRANVAIDDPNDPELVVPLIRGHEYSWIMTRTDNEIYLIDGMDVPFLVERPQYAFVERVYQYPSEAVGEGSSFDDLGLN